MERKTESKMVSEFTFCNSELQHLGLDSERIDYMEQLAREDLKKIGLPFMGGVVDVDFGHDFGITTLRLTI